MKIRVALAALAVAGLSVSAAVAAPPPGKGKPLTTGLNCKPKVTVVLKGTFSGLSANILTMTATHGNRWARTWVTAGAASVTVDPNTTKVRRNGKKTLADLVPGDWLLVQARACKAELEATTPPPLMAVRIVAHPVKA